MKRKPQGSSRDLRRRAFGTAGQRGGTDGQPTGSGEVFDFVEAALRRPFPPAGAGRRKPRPGKVYDFPVRRVVEEK
jgi:hypothetical protein